MDPGLSDSKAHAFSNYALFIEKPKKYLDLELYFRLKIHFRNLIWCLREKWEEVMSSDLRSGHQFLWCTIWIDAYLSVCLWMNEWMDYYIVDWEVNIYICTDMDISMNSSNNW